MTTIPERATDLLMRLCDRPEAGVADDGYGNYCVYCADRAHHPAHRRFPEHMRDCPILAGKKLLNDIYGEDHG